MSASSQNPGRDPNVQRYRSALDAAIEVVQSELLHDNTGTSGDAAYNQAITDAVAVIARLRDGVR
ncbi:hypothetical protein [Streptomyces sp. NPDC020983]|uniref:hypothetical protein n=1 Tax=Streptomyces sp. NPDC020983 TaxID=3365106 RepID=UPI0037B76A5A